MYHNRDISWLGFNHRVLQEAADTSVPLLERVKFLSIFSSNMDEFFRVRYPIISLYSQLKNKTLHKIDPSVDKKLYERVQEVISSQLEEYGSIVNGQILPELEANGIILYYNRSLPSGYVSQIRELFFSRILAFIQPVFIESFQRNFFPGNNKIYFFALLKKEGRDALAHAVINIPADKLPRFFQPEVDGKEQHIVFLDDIIRENLNCIFPGFAIHGCYSFKITRDSELYLDEEGIEKDILKKIEKQLAKRDLGSPTRLLYEAGMPLSVQKFLAELTGLKQDDLYEGGRYHNLSDLSSLPVKRKDLEYASWSFLKPIGLEYCGDIFRQIEAKDLLLHFPYESYNPVLAFFNQAAIDPDVQSISVTLYRVAAESHIVNALISAAKNKKKVQVFVELKARFDEANNIKWSKAMVDAGVKIIYSIPRIKVHSKIALVKRKTADGVNGYGYIGTGNFNETTARFYTDHALFTTRQEVIKDLSHLFNILGEEKGPQKNASGEFHHLLVSQYNMVNVFEKEINEQIKRKEKGKEALIRIKVNNLEDTYMIDLLYKAAKAGVDVHLLVRGICCIVPGRENLSETIRVKRIIDRFLEHSRIFIFGTGDDTKIYIGSADWMTRNLQHRIEVCIPIPDSILKDDLINYFGIQWSDTVKAVSLDEELRSFKTNDLEQAGQPGPQEKIYRYLKSRS
ncbi:polyphosphate kinase 1 [Terrimonas pollutisoli]|uniref:polyphosphate kinase 1 n=1 Tax=Terrimonas pollutisoli TaxID=3034147 RepID=UPI0023ED1732|nr:polyphosphate kinase 1 [Terrimonas sp. H1YJ31]